ncbi:MAG: hypothetical protein EOO73_13020 [Myxococcales bacterium]|nr:MAG: hypothetical protein EOO73_13020 [Myxococcales bacterium]
MVRVWGFGFLLLAACGGRASGSEGLEPVSGSGAGGSEGVLVGGAGGSELAHGGGGAGASTPVGCPDASSPSCEASFLLDLSFDGTSTKTSDGSVWAEPLQLPAFAPVSPGPSVPVDPADWDRSRLPVGACVFKLHGARESCLNGRFSRISAGACQERPLVVFTAYYEVPHCTEAIAPGCASDDRFLTENQVWYTAPDSEGNGETLLVLCAGLCAPFVSSADADSKMCVLGGPVP